MELAIHLTGRYPDNWKGKIYDRPVRAWAVSETTEVCRDTIQRLLIGEPKLRETWGTGAIPYECLPDFAVDGSTKGWSVRSGIADALATLTVKHASGGISTLGFKSYDMRREKFQGETLSIVYMDEEPPLDIYMECLTRTNAVPDSMVYITFTPLKGVSDVVMMFMKDTGMI